MKGALKGSAASTCGPLRCALATALERARSSRRVSSCCSAGEEEQQETPAAAWCTLFLNILCILCTVFLNVEEHAQQQLSEAQRACNGQGHELSKDTRGALHSRQTAANGMGETGLEMDTRAKMSGVGAVRINVLAVLCRRLGFWGVGTKRVAYESIVRWDSSVHPICLCCNKKNWPNRMP